MDAKFGRLLEKMVTKIKEFENKAHIRLLGINYRDHKMNIYIKEKINSYMSGKFMPLLSIIKKRKFVLVWPRFT